MPTAHGVPSLAKRLVVVTGKGGVGKSTVAAAIGLAAARRGRRTIVAELSGRTDVAALLGGRAAGRMREPELAPGLHHVSISAELAMTEYLRDEVPGRLPGVILARSRAFELFTAATPGLRELLMIGKAYELAQHPRHHRGAEPYDLVVLDAPATGHALALLSAPRTFSSIARVGPIARQGAAVDGLLRNAHMTGVIGVTTPEQLAVSEALGLRAALGEEDPSITLDGIVVNRVFAAHVRPGDAAALAAAPDDPAVRSARWLAGRARSQRAHVARLRRGLAGVPLATLPFRATGDLAPADVTALAERLGGWLA